MAASFAKYGALVALVAQNTIGVIGMRYTRVADGPMYLSSSAVLITEVDLQIYSFVSIDTF